MQTTKKSGQFENSVFEIRAIKENTRFIARCPLCTYYSCIPDKEIRGLRLG